MGNYPFASPSSVQIDTTASDIKPPHVIAAAGSTGLAADAGHVHPGYGWVPSDQGLSAASVPAPWASAVKAVSGGFIYGAKIVVPAAGTITNILMMIINNGSGLTSGQNLVGLYNASGTLLSGAADQTVAFGTAGVKTIALTSSQVVTADQVVYAAVVCNGTTPPTFAAGASVLLLDSGVSSSAPAAFVSSSGAQTSMPASITLASQNLTSGSNIPWFGLS